MSVIRLTTDIEDQVQRHLFTRPGEHFGFLLADTAVGPDGPIFLVEGFHPIPDDEVSVSMGVWEVSTGALLEAINVAVRAERALIEVHNHSGPWSCFSPADREGLKEFVPYVLDSLSGRPYAATVWTEHGAYAEYFLQGGESGEVRSVTAVGEGLTQLAAGPPDRAESRFARQEPWFTRGGQQRLGKLRVAVVGLGGTGSHVVRDLVYLGVRDFLLVDDDLAEDTNMNRLVTADAADLGTPKAILARRMIRRVAPEAQVRALTQKVPSAEALAELKGADVVFGCVDNDGARLILNELCLAYAVPLIDLAVGIEAQAGEVELAGGRVALVLPDAPCLNCMGEIDAQEAHYFLSESAEQELADELGYVDSLDVPAPAVVSLNAAVGAAAVNEFAMLVSATRSPCNYLDVDLVGRARSLHGQWHTPRRVDRKGGCVQCGIARTGDGARIERYANQGDRTAV